MESINLGRLHTSFTARVSLYMTDASSKRVASACKLEINSRLKPTFKGACGASPLSRDLRELNPESQINLTRAGLMSTEATRMAGI